MTKPKFWMVVDGADIDSPRGSKELAVQDAEALSKEYPRRKYIILEAIKEFRGGVVVGEEELG